MKKSSSLMLSYIIILLLTTIADTFYDWNGIDQVALAATMAGFFFALADYCGWDVSYNQPMVDAQKDYLNTYEFYLNEVLDMSNRDEEDRNQAITLLEPYSNSHVDVAEVLGEASKLAEIINQVKTNAHASLEKLPDRMRAITKKEKKIKKSRLNETVFATIGFLVFFLLIIFDALSEILMPSSSITTVAAFAYIMFNYFLKDLFEADIQKEVAETAALCREMREDVNNYKANNKKRTLLENAQKLISDISEITNHEEDVDHGQT